jgi:hypothetical protein
MERLLVKINPNQERLEAEMKDMQENRTQT